MKYSKFCCYRSHTTSLTKKEIENPYLVLDELYRKRTVTDFQNKLWPLHQMIFKEYEWRNHDPSDLYILCLDILRLTDSLWLLNKYCPEISTPAENLQSISKDARLMREVNLLFSGFAGKDREEVKQTTVLKNYFDNHHHGFNRSDMFCYLQLGLDASYMLNSKYEFFCLGDHETMRDFCNLSELIAEGYSIYQQGAVMFPDLRSCKETIFAIDYDRPTLLTYECLKAPSDTAKDIFQTYFDISCLHTGLNAWKALFYEENYWEEGNNPGNLIYLVDSLVKLIDAVWMMCEKQEAENFISRYNAPVQIDNLIKNCSAEEINSPIIAIQRFFVFKKLHKWKRLLNKWLVYSLSNSGKQASCDRDKIELAFVQLLKFIEATYLLVHIPETTLTPNQPHTHLAKYHEKTKTTSQSH